MTHLPQAILNAIASQETLRTWWAQVMFNLEDEDEAQWIEAQVARRLRLKAVPLFSISAYLEVLPLLMEPAAMQAYARRHPQTANALPEVLNPAEALALIRLDHPAMTEPEEKAILALLPETQAPLNALWKPVMDAAAAKFRPKQTVSR